MQNVEKPANDAGNPSDEPLRRSVEKAVPKAEQLPTGPDENPISERVREAGKDPRPAADDLTVQGGNRVEP